MDARALHGLAASQRWLLTNEQVLRHATPGQIDHALRTGFLKPHRSGVYATWGATDDWLTRLLAVCLSSDAVASHRSAARAFGIGGVPAVRLEVTTPAPRRIRMPGVVCHESNILLPEFVTTVNGIPVTTPERTCIDLSAVVGFETLERAWQSADMLGLVTAESIQRCVIKMLARGRRRMATVHELLGLWVPGYNETDSALEARNLKWILSAGIEMPEIQHWTVANGERYCLDLAWPGPKVCLESDGWKSHKNRGRFDGDRDKVTELELAGWLVILATSRHDKRTIIDRVVRALAMRSA